MHDALPVGMIERIGHLGCQPGDLAEIEPARHHPVQQARAVDQLGDDEDRPLVTSPVMDGDDPGMFQPGRRPSLAEEALFLIGTAEGSSAR